MEENKPTDYLRKYGDIFKDKCFRFKDLETHIEEQYIKIVTDLGAEVSNDASYTFIDISNIQNYDDRELSDLYDITYILDSIRAKKPLDISSYRCKNDDSDTSDVTDETFMDIDEIESIETPKIIELANDSIVENGNNNSENENPETSLVSDKENISDNIFENQDSNDNERTSKYFDGEIIKGRKKMKITTTNYNSDSDLSLTELSFDNEEENVNKNRKNWWQGQDISDNEVCRIRNCSFEPKRHKSHESPRRIMSLTEKQILLKYLIMTNSISQGKGSKIWCLMRDAGYLVHRTVETLRNCLRRTILPDIRSFGLPNYILKQFLDLAENKNKVS